MRLSAMRQPPWMAFAWAELGQREIAGPRSNPRIASYIARSGHPNLADDATAWCAAFVGASLDASGIAGTGSLMARSYLDWGRAADTPELGAIAVLSRGADPALGHVGFLVGETGDQVLLLGGNQSDSVSVEAFARTRLLSLRLPQAASDVTTSPPETGDADGFIWSLARILEFEGGFSDDPFDPGGPTNKGITLADFARFKGEPVTAESRYRLVAELKRISDAAVARIFRERYWQPARCPDLPPALAHFHFDAAVNQGVGGAARMLQEALGVAIDGEIGPITLGTARARSIDDTLERYADVRRGRYRALGHFWRFGRGWLARVDKALSQARSLGAARQPPANPPAKISTPPITMQKDTQPMPDTTQPPFPSASTDGKWWGSSMTIWGTLLTTLTTVAPVVLSVLGIDIPGPLIERLGSEIVVVAQAIGGLAGTIMAIAGRARASAPLARRPMAIKL